MAAVTHPVRRVVLVGTGAWLLLVGAAGPAGAVTGLVEDADTLVEETTDAVLDLDGDTGTETESRHDDEGGDTATHGETLHHTADAVDETVATVDETADETADEVETTLSDGTDAVRRVIERSIDRPPASLPSLPGPDDGVGEPSAPSPPGGGADQPTGDEPTPPAPLAPAVAEREGPSPLAGRGFDSGPAPPDLSGLTQPPGSEAGLTPLHAPGWLLVTASTLFAAVALGHALNGYQGLRRA